MLSAAKLAAVAPKLTAKRADLRSYAAANELLTLHLVQVTNEESQLLLEFCVKLAKLGMAPHRTREQQQLT